MLVTICDYRNSLVVFFLYPIVWITPGHFPWSHCLDSVQVKQVGSVWKDNFILIEGVYYEPWGKIIRALADLFWEQSAGLNHSTPLRSSILNVIQIRCQEVTAWSSWGRSTVVRWKSGRRLHSTLERHWGPGRKLNRSLNCHMVMETPQCKWYFKS